MKISARNQLPGTVKPVTAIIKSTEVMLAVDD
jgi:molybdopterin-binding protein